MREHIGTLGKKRRVANEDFQRARDTATQLITREHIDDLTDEVFRRYDQIERENGFSRFAVAFSGGKDSLVVQHMFFSRPYFWVRCNLEYTAFEQFMAKTGCDVVNTGQDIRWLAAHPQFLFPKTSNEAARWFSMVQWAGQTSYFRDRGLDCLIMGRRKQDGNRMGRHNEDLYTNEQGVTRFAPIWDWTHEEVFAYIAYHGLELPPCYSWPDGYIVATGPWAKRRAPTPKIGWGAVYKIEPGIVYRAADYIPSAHEWLTSIAQQLYDRAQGAI